MPALARSEERELAKRMHSEALKVQHAMSTKEKKSTRICMHARVCACTLQGPPRRFKKAVSRDIRRGSRGVGGQRLRLSSASAPAFVGGLCAGAVEAQGGLLAEACGGIATCTAAGLAPSPQRHRGHCGG